MVLGVSGCLRRLVNCVVEHSCLVRRILDCWRLCLFVEFLEVLLETGIVAVRSSTIYYTILNTSTIENHKIRKSRFVERA